MRRRVEMKGRVYVKVKIISRERSLSEEGKGTCKSRERCEVIIGHWEKSLLPYFFVLVLMSFLSK